MLFALSGCEKKSEESRTTTSTSSKVAKDKPKPAVEILFAYGSEKKAWLKDAIATFNADPTLQKDQRIQVKGVALGSGAAIEEFISEGTKAHCWSPASGVFVDLLNEAWTKQHGAIGGGKTVAPEGKALALSPVVIAMWKPMAKALGWPEIPVGWADIIALSLAKNGWASRGHPEWGQFKLGHTHPRYSNSGLQSVVAEAHAAAGKRRALTSEDLKQPKVERFMSQIEQSMVHYGKSTGFFAEKMLERGPSFLSAAVLYENLVVDSYRRPEFKHRPMDLVALYPKEGTFWIDNPFVVLNAPWVSDTEKRASTTFRDYLLSKTQQERAMSEFGLRPADANIAIGAPINTAHGVDPAQPKALLDMPSTAVVSDALELWARTKKTVDIMFIFDRSSSMHGEPLVEAKRGAVKFIESLDDRDRVSLLTFNDQVPASISTPVVLSRERGKLIEQLDGIFANGGTALYDAILAGHEKLSKLARKDPKRIYALVALTDGDDQHSKLELSALNDVLGPKDEAIGPPVRLFTIAYGSDANGRVLGALAERGGGAFFTGNTANIGRVYRDLASFF